MNQLASLVPPNQEAILQQYVDSTMMSAFRSCPRKFFHEFVLGLRPKTVSIHLHAGGAFAKALETFYDAVHNEKLTTIEALKVAFIDFRTAWGVNYLDYTEGPKSFDNVWAAVESYVSFYPPLTDHLQPFRSDDGKTTTEFSFAIPLDAPDFPRHPVSNDPFIYVGRFDMLGILYGKTPCVKDDKTTGAAGASWAAQWDLRSQFLGYVWACQQCGIPLETVVVRGVVLQKREIKHVEAVKHYPKYLVDRWYEQLKHDLHRLVHCWNSGYFDYNFGESCTNYGNCIFTSVCQSANQGAWMQEYQVQRWNPLLRAATADASDPVNAPAKAGKEMTKETSNV